MKSDTLLRHPVETPGAHTPSGQTLPDDVLSSAARRLKRACWIYAIGFVTVFGVHMLTTPDFHARRTFPVELTVVALSVLAATIVLGIVSTRRLRPTTLLDIGLLFEVAGGFGISMVEHWGFFGGDDFKIFGVSWICVWIIMFPLIVPSTPGKTFLAAFATATTGIIAYTLSTAFYRGEAQPFPVLVQLFLPNYICTLLALVTARIVYDLGRKVKDARTLGAYELVERLGAGGMGEVWRARHQFLSRPAAIKLIRPEALSAGGGGSRDALRLRFEREAQATASLQSVHSIALYDFGSTRHGIFYYVMELLCGCDLQRLVERFGPVPAARAVYILDQVCHSLDDAHRAGLIHRDVKPANIYLCRLGGDCDFVKVLDFGIVKELEPGATGPGEATAHGFCGTPGFIAPEIVVGATQGDPRSDIYSLGCVAYWLLTGEPVFPGRTPLEIVRAHVASDPVPPSRRGARELPPTLEAIVMTCLAHDPDVRYASMAEVRTALETVELLRPWTSEDARAWWEAHDPSVEPNATTHVMLNPAPPRPSRSAR